MACVEAMLQSHGPLRVGPSTSFYHNIISIRTLLVCEEQMLLVSKEQMSSFVIAKKYNWPLGTAYAHVHMERYWFRDY